MNTLELDNKELEGLQDILTVSTVHPELCEHLLKDLDRTKNEKWFKEEE